MNLSFQQAIDLHSCLRYIEAIQGLSDREDSIEYGDATVRFVIEDGAVNIVSVHMGESKCVKGAKVVQDFFDE